MPVGNQVAADERSGDTASDAPIADGAIDARTDDAHRVGRRSRRRRVSRWDRPPEPHDWRYYVSTVGKVLIATGLLMFGFVAYQLWGTGIETARAQNRLEDRFDSILAEHDGNAAGTDVVTAAPGVDDTPQDASDNNSDSTSDDTVVDDIDANLDDTADETPAALPGAVTSVAPIAVDLSDDAVEQEPIPQPFRGDPLLRLEIPAIGRDDIVVPGVNLNDLKDGPGHYPDTPLPGQLGNAAIAGHRTTYGAPFFDVDQLEPGDEIIATLLNGDRFVYEVTFVDVVSASDYHVVSTQNPDIAELTLTSCHPKYTARDRIIVHSVLDPDRSSNVGFPTFYTLDDDGDDEPLAGDDPVVTADANEVTEPDSAPGELDEPPVGDETGTDDDTVGPPTAGDDGPVGAEAAANQEDDAFSQGWFDDRAAFPQIALWGMALTMITLLAYQVAKRYRRDSIGVLVGIVPFVIALYFFYQNINRLLPPGI